MEFNKNNKFKFPMIKVSSNEIYSGRNWRKRYDLKNAYHWLVKAQKIKYKIKKYPVKFKIIFEFKSRILDSDNCSYMVKLLIDALIKTGMLKNDDPKHLKSVELESRKGGCDIILLEVIDAKK